MCSVSLTLIRPPSATWFCVLLHVCSFVTWIHIAITSMLFTTYQPNVHENCTKLLQIRIVYHRKAHWILIKNDIIFFCFTCKIFYLCTMKREIWTLNTYKTHASRDKENAGLKRLCKNEHDWSMRAHFFTLVLSLSLDWVINQDNGIATSKREKCKNDFNGFRAKQSAVHFMCIHTRVWPFFCCLCFRLLWIFSPANCMFCRWLLVFSLGDVKHRFRRLTNIRFCYYLC